MRAVILAGGKGTRLAPYTTVFPKALMPVGERPILELLLAQLRDAGVTRASLAVGHLVTGSLSIPLASFEAGDYRLEIKVSDKVSSKSITENVTFNVGA